MFIAIPGDGGKGPCSSFFAHMVGHTTARGINVNIVNPRGSDLIFNRTAAARTALENNATHILWVDSDMIMREDAAIRLLNHKLPVVGLNSVAKTGELNPTSTIRGSGVSSVGKTGLQKVTSTGLAFVLTDAEIYQNLEFPWFGHKWTYRGMDNDHIGPPKNWGLWSWSFEDAWFFERVRKAGYDIYIDHDASQSLGHYGGGVYYCDRVEATN